MNPAKAIASEAPSLADSSRAVKAEDHALGRVPRSWRKSGWELSKSTVGIATALVIFAIGGFAVILAGFTWGLVAGAAVAVVGAVLSILVGRISYAEGISATVASRFYGFGFKGSSLATVIFGFMILGFLALENALLYEGTLLMFGWQDSWGTRILLYGLMTIGWVLLAVFGMNLTLRSSMLLTVATVLLTIYAIWILYFQGGARFGDVFSSQGVVPGGAWPKFEAAFALMGGTAGTIALLIADFARYARTGKDVVILGVVGPIAQNFVMVVVGAVVIVGGLPAVAEFLMARDSGLGRQAALAAASGFAMGNTGAFFVVAASWLGFITIYVAQAKAQVINTYSGSLSLSNLVDVLAARRPGRVVMVIVGNVIALIMISAGILSHFSSWLGYLGAMTLSFVGVMISDFYWVRGGEPVSDGRAETVNWAGIASVLIASVLGIALIATGVMPLGFMVSLAVALLLYPVLRFTVLPAGRFTTYQTEERSLHEAI
ncbi:MAG: cytosine permease [Burkholderiales bacterium]|nr:cytosine permease [Burkholderiales bacterium]OJX07163.1 MAG: hypothetical protein BGO72_14815 [Burkholderiales bacterium 70-64]